MTQDLTERLRDYESLKFELAEVLRELAILIPQDRSATRTKLTDLLARLAEDRFNLVFVGRFNRGKTSLMNALLGSPWLPTGILPLTSVITSVAYGSAEKVQVEFENGPFRYDISMAALPDYITEKGNPGNVRRLRQAHISLPSDVLRRGFHFVDTPGLGSAIVENTQTTEGFYSEADAIACVTAYDAPLTEEETHALRIFAAARVPTLVILNKQDTLSAAKREEITAYVHRQLTSLIPDATPPILSVSATLALAAKARGDTNGLAKSGLPELEAALAQLLAMEKGRAVIAGVRERAIALLEEFKPAAEKTFRERLRTIGVREGSDDFDRGPLRQGTHSQRMSGCAVCVRVGNGLYDFLRKYQHELAESRPARERLATVGGFCPRHTWLYASMSQDRDVCLALIPLMKRITSELAQSLGKQDNVRRSEDGSPAYSPIGSACALCALQEQLELAALRDLAKHFVTTPEDPSENSPGVCLPHLRKLSTGAGHFPSDASRERLVAALEQTLAAAAERLTEDMQRYVLRRDAIRHGLASEEEIQAAKRVLGFLAGSRAFPPQP